MHTKDDIINFKKWVTLITHEKSKSEGIDLNQLTISEVSDFVFNAIKEKNNRQ